MDCNLDKKITLCDPDDMKSDNPLSTNICKDLYRISITGVMDDMKCCYLTGKSLQNKNVYSCIGIDDMFYTKEEMKTKIESGEYERLGPVTDIKIDCGSEGSNSISSFFLDFFFLWLLYLAYLYKI